MDTNKLKKFAQEARVQLIAQVGTKMGFVLAEGSSARREASAAVETLEREIRASSSQQVIEKVAYTWFNRLTALRFMDANGYTNPRVVTPAEGQTLPEILADAKSSTFDEAIREPVRKAVTALLDGRTPSRDGQGEAYRLLLVAVCNHWHAHMPFMFEKIADYTELLMPEDLLSSDSILSHIRVVMTDEDCRDVEIIGWLYQFYISEKKDQVFSALKKNVKIGYENIPAATQLFTPHWIVRYLVENSLGRLWLLSRPQSKLATRMDYYIAPKDSETDFLRIARPEDIRICDPACGSGHMLTYAFDLLIAIYEEEGYEASQIPGLILTHNLTGIEIDDRAGALAAFALTMKAAALLGRRRFLRSDVQPKICVLQDVRFTPAEMHDVSSVVGHDLFTSELQVTLAQFEHAKNFGSLIVPKLRDPAEVARVVRLRDFGGDLLLRDVQDRVLKVLEMSEALSPKYHIVVANPPYMGGGGMNPQLQEFAKSNYPDSKADLFAMFIERSLTMNKALGLSGILTIQNWMFLSSFEKFRKSLLRRSTITNLNQIGFNSFPELNSKYAVACASVFHKGASNRAGAYIDLHSAPPSADKQLVFFQRLKEGLIFWKTSADFQSIPGMPISYSAGSGAIKAFADFPKLIDGAHACSGLQTGDNDRFLRQWFEVENTSVQDVSPNGQEARKWRFHRKGGDFRKWYGNIDYVVDWEKDGEAIRSHKSARPQNLDYWYRPGATWSHTSLYFGARLLREVDTFNVEGPAAFMGDGHNLLAFLCSRPAAYLMQIMNPTLHFLVGSVSLLPVANLNNLRPPAKSLVSLSRSDWDAYETSWDFTTLPLLASDLQADTLAGTYASLRVHWCRMINEMQLLESENNRIFIDAYGLQDELTPEVPLEEITLTCNPSYRYGGKASEAELEVRLLSDTMAEFLHYSVGCMFGRYSLDAPGLILAKQGEGLADYLARVPNPTFTTDADNVIPLVEGDWFADDISARFRKFLRVTFGEPNFQENLTFIETALGKDIGKWFIRDFFDYHVRRFKKRPIYWMFSSPKGTFNALIYMHRYRPDTISVMLNDYLREFINRLQAERARLDKLADDPAASQAQRTKALKDIGVLIKQIDELTLWERDVVFPLAQAKIKIDLDDGVKANYPKFGAALKTIKGLDGKEDE